MDILDFELPEEISPQSTTINDGEPILNYLNRLEGYKTRIKNIHWSAKLLPYNEKEAVHVKLDEVFDELGDYQDSIAEVYMGALHKSLPMGFLKGNLPETNDPLELIEMLRGDLVSFHSQHKDDILYIGMINSTEDFIQTLDNKRYLTDLTK